MAVDHGDLNPHVPAQPVFTPQERAQARRLSLVLALIAAFFVVELGGALAARSVVLQADALHLLMDVLALAMSLLAMRVAVRRPTARFTFGMRRAEPVAAIFNGLLVLVATGEIVREALVDLTGHEAKPEAMRMLVVAAAALVVNGISAWLIHGALHGAGAGAHGHAHKHGHPHAGDDFGHADHGHADHGHHAHGHEGHGHVHGHGHAHHEHAKAAGHSLNLRGAWLHLLGDTLCSLAALVAAVVIWMGGPAAFDPIASLLVAVVLLLGAARLLRDATTVLLEAAPPHLPVTKVRSTILAHAGVAEVHDLHVWTLGAGHDAITAHVRVAAETSPDIARKVSEALRSEFGAEYVTVQVEPVE
jgi:cation diffusion facilitator family transporter